ncbi:redoxin family protein [Lysobacter silvisoli]|uniref:TlpA family protein disulfide reductase n=1 Tax=Lysobacter silvisoli TaxID=2293254 RepID=A0A371JXU8_9GAMM|nr:redoxin family protein [Lysobacter silvisoli]RDZ26437.1 TlpA family protein disulfide reductase [Lysobacter silvisoli]
MRRESVAYAALALACALIAVLGVQNRQLRYDYAALIEDTVRPPVGGWLPSAQAEVLGGGRLTLGRTGGERQVLYFFDPTCPVCEASVPAILELSGALQRAAGGAQLVGVARQEQAGLDGYLRARGFAFPVALSTPRIRALFHLRRVPLLVVVDRDGRVVYSHAGLIDTKEQVPTILTALRATERHAMPQHVAVGSSQWRER